MSPRKRPRTDDIKKSEPPMKKVAGAVRLSYNYLLKSEWLAVHHGNRVIGTSGVGYSSVFATHMVCEGRWYFEVKYTGQDCSRRQSHFRVGFAQITEDVISTACRGEGGYMFGSRNGIIYHNAKPRRYYGKMIEQGDVVGCLLDLPKSRRSAIAIRRCFTYLDKKFEETRAMSRHEQKIAPPQVPSPAIDWADQESHDDKVMKPVIGSRVEFFVNGESCGPAFRDINEGCYFPVIAIYMGAVIDANFGPQFLSPLPEGALPYNKSILSVANTANSTCNCPPDIPCQSASNGTTSESDMALRLNFRSAEHCTPRRRQIRGSVLANGMPAPRLALDRILFERGFTRLSETDDRRMGIYRVICKQLRIADRKVRRIARLVENQLHLYYNGLAREGKERHTDSANDRLRILSRIFRCSITIFGTNDMKHHRHFSSGGDVRAIMLLEVRPSRYEALQFLEEYRFIEEPQYDEMRSLDFAMQTLNLEPFYATPVMSDFQMFHTSVFQSPPSQNLAYPMLDRCPFF